MLRGIAVPMQKIWLHEGEGNRANKPSGLGMRKVIRDEVFAIRRKFFRKFVKTLRKKFDVCHVKRAVFP